MNTKLAANYGTMAGLIAFGYFVILAMAGLNPLGNFKLIGSLIPIYFLYAGTKKYRDTDLGGYIRYGQGFMFSLTTSFFYASIFAILVYLYGKVIDVELLEIYKNDVMQNFDKAAQVLGDNNKLMDEAIKQIEKITIGSLAWGEYWNKVIWGTVISLIIAKIVKKEKTMFDDTSTDNIS